MAIIFKSGHGRGVLIYCLAGYTASFALSSGSVIWVYMSEIFPNVVRVKGQALGSTVLWVMNGIISQFFPLMAAKSLSFPYIFFETIMVAQFFAVLFFFPETKGLSLEQVQSKLRMTAA